MGLTKPRAHQLQDIDYKQTARALTDTNITLSGGAPATVDGVSLALHDRVLVTGQTDASENGIYYVTTVGAGSDGTWARSLDANETGELNGGTIIMVTEGTNHADTQWKLTTDDPITIGSTNLNFALNSSAAYGVIAVAGQSSISANSVGDTLTVATGNNIVVTTNAGTETLTIAANDTPSFDSVTVTGNITAAGLSYPTSDGTANQVIQTDGSGTLSFANASGGGATVSSDTTTNAERLIYVGSTTSGNLSAVTQDSGLTYNPSTGSLTSAAFIGNLTGGAVTATSLSVNSAYSLPTADGSANQLLKTDGSGTLSFSDLTVADASMTVNNFTGDNSTTAFTITTAPSNANSLLVTINGITQRPTTDYTVSGTTLTFVTAPFTGANISSRLIGGSVGGGGSTDLSAITESIIPDTDVTYDLGTSSKRFRDLYLSGSTIDLGGATMSIDGTSGAIALVPKATIGTPNPVGVVFTGSGELKTVTSSGGAVSSSDIETAADSNDVSPSTTVVTNPTDLPNSPTAGTMGYVTSNNKLYIYTGSGWYVVAAVNQTPTVSGANASYTLATDQTPTVVTLSATDPEGLPITWSSTTSGLGSIATVTNVDNVFTITPSADTGGTFSVTFRASDGVNIGTANSSFSLVFTVENSNYTRLLVKADAVSTDNQVDASSSSHTITENGNVTSTAFTPYHLGGYSTSFDGVSDYLSFTMTSAFNLTGDFTLECWFNPNALALDTQHPNIIKMGTYQLYLNSASNFVGISPDGASVTLQSANSSIALNTWYHVAVVRSGSSEAMFLNGTRVDTNTASTVYGASSGTSLIGTYSGTGGDYNGTIRDLRLVNGTAIYDPSETTISTPIEPLTAVTNTSLLTCHLPYIADGSSNNHTITSFGNTSTKRFGPYDTLGYTKADHGGSVYFDGSGDYLQSASNADFGFGTGDFTVEWWAYQTQLNSYSVVFATGYGVGGIGSHMRSNGDITVTRPGTAVDHTFTAGATSANRWYHVALVRSGTDLTCFVDGVSKGTVTNSTNYAAGTLNIGIDGNNGSSPYKGYISDFRSVKGTAVYTSNFTPPTERLTAIANTSLLTCTNKNDIWEQGSGSLLTKAGNTTASNTQRKFTTSSAMYFDGTGDYLSFSNSTDFDIAGDLSWTIEGWWYWNSNSGEQVLIEKFTGGTGPGWTLYKLNGGPIGFYSGSSGAFSNAIHTVTTGQWYHVALSRDATTDRTRAFVDGVLKVDSTYSIGNNSSGNLYIGTRNGSGSYMNGYVQDVRFTKGLARYTSSFTPPSSEFNG